MSTITVNIPDDTAVPRSATVFATWFVAFLGLLERTADRRVQSRQLASRIKESARVRGHAQKVMARDPRVAAELIAAADRHEQG